MIDEEDRIIAVALRKASTGFVFALPPEVAKRHGDLMREARERALFTPLEMADAEQGFQSERCPFLTREDAMVLASVNGQLRPRALGQYDGPELFSEDLW